MQNSEVMFNSVSSSRRRLLCNLRSSRWSVAASCGLSYNFCNVTSYVQKKGYTQFVIWAWAKPTQNTNRFAIPKHSGRKKSKRKLSKISSERVQLVWTNFSYSRAYFLENETDSKFNDFVLRKSNYKIYLRVLLILRPSSSDKKSCSQ